MSLNGTLATARSSLELSSLGIQIAGQNISNANTPGYIREQLRIETQAPYRIRSTLVGGGAVAAGVKQQIDAFLERRIYTANSDQSASGARSSAYTQLQTSLNELGDSDLSSSLNKFLSAVQGSINQPESASLRQYLVQSAQEFSRDVRSTRSRVEELQRTQDQTVKSLVDEANSLLDTIEKLNPQITSLEANGLDVNDAGGLRVQRLNALNRLSQIVPLRVTELESGAVDLSLGSNYLLLEGHSQRLETVSEVVGDKSVLSVQLTETKSPIPSAGGELRGVLDGRDQILSGYLDDLDTWVGSIIEQVNRVHSGGEGTVGFTTLTSDRGPTSASVPLNQAGLPFAPSHGSFDIKIINQSTGVSQTHTISIDLDGLGTDTTLTSLTASLDGLPNFSASITSDGHLQLDAASGYEFRFAGDDTGTLAALGINNLFTGDSADTINVNSAIVANPSYLAGGQGGGPSDNRNLVAIADAFEKGLNQFGGQTIAEQYEAIIGGLAKSGSAEEALAKGYAGFTDSLTTQREQRSGVNIDEEAIKMLELQRSYQAAARIISTVDELLNVLLQM